MSDCESEGEGDCEREEEEERERESDEEVEREGERVSERVSETVNDTVSETVNDTMSDTVSETVSERDVLQRDSEQNTPLARCLRSLAHSHPHSPSHSAIRSLHTLLEANAAASIFVKGYSPGSLICTLPMAQQPPSSVFTHPPPVQVPSDTLALLDSHLAQYVTSLYELKVKKQFEIDRNESVLKAVLPDVESLDHRIVRLLLECPDSQASGNDLANSFKKKYGESLSLSQLNQSLMSTKAVKVVDSNGRKVYRFVFLRPTECCIHVPSGESVRVISVVPTDCTEYLVEFNHGVKKQVALDNLSPIGAIQATINSANSASITVFSHPGCAKLRPANVGGGVWKMNGFNGVIRTCYACGGSYHMCSGSYSFRNRKIGLLTEGASQDAMDCPESPNDKFCTALCEQYGNNGQGNGLPSAGTGGTGARAKGGNACFRLGDKVMLSPCQRVGATFVPAFCLGYPKDMRVGIVVKVEKVPLSDDNKWGGGKSAGGGRGLRRGFGDKGGSGGKGGAAGRGSSSVGGLSADSMVHVMALESGLVDSYANNTLRFADGSDVVPQPEVSGAIPVSIPDGLAVIVASGTKPSSFLFNIGDFVKLRKDSRDKFGCLGDPRWQWIGSVRSLRNGVEVTCFNNSSRVLSTNHSYESKDLLLAHAFEQDGIQALVVGEHVQLSDSFHENDNDGWCLGKTGETPKTGVVVFAPHVADNSGLNREQRHIGVVAETDTTATNVFWFRGSWLKRADVSTKRSFKIGDRVQLDPAKWAFTAPIHGKKCLGSPIEAAYGLIINSGVKQKDGSARNIEVMALVGSRSQEISLYSSFDLLHAHRAAVLTVDDKRYLTECVGRCMKECNIDRGCIDIQSFVDLNGLNVWGTLFELSFKSPLVEDAWAVWRSGLESAWPDALLDTDALRNMSFTPARPNCHNTTWKCCKRTGGKCRGTVNTGADRRCRMCGVTAKKWKCSYCSCANKSWHEICIACAISRQDAEALIASRILQARQLAEEKELERLRLLAIEAKLTMITSNVADDDIPEGKFLHPGSLSMCGGNPNGFAKCAGNGACSSSGPSSCQDCGAGTHWSCCFSDDVNSKFCVEGISHDQAKLHAKILADISSVRRRVCDIHGIVFTTEAPDWSCPACTSVNVMSNLKCKICDTEAPQNIREKQRSFTTKTYSSRPAVCDQEPGIKARIESTNNKKGFQGKLSSSLVILSDALEREKLYKDVRRESVIENGKDVKACDDVTCAAIVTDSDNEDYSDSYGLYIDDEFTDDGDSTSDFSMDDEEAKHHFDEKNNDNWGPQVLPDDWEIEQNVILCENYFHSTLSNVKMDDQSCVSEMDISIMSSPPPLMSRFTSTSFFNLSSYDKLPDIDAFCHFVDKNGNTACHHAAYIGLHQTFDLLVKHGASRWQENNAGDTPNYLRDGYALGSGAALSRFHKILTKRSFISQQLLSVALSTPFNYEPDESVSKLLDTIHANIDEYDAAFLIDEAMRANYPHALLYRALFSLVFGYGPIQAKKDLHAYEEGLLADLHTAELDPLYFLVRFKLFFNSNGKMLSFAKQDRLSAYDALSAFRCFPMMAYRWLDPGERFDEEIRLTGIETDDPPPDSVDDDYSDLFPPLGPNDPETLWQNAKEEYGLVSASMDALMNLTGLKEVKRKAKDVCLTVLLNPPKDLLTCTSCNFTFIGNPGTGKSTVAELLSKAMSELKYRKNATPVLTSADDILGDNQPVEAFSKIVQDAEGGTLFIDEAYLFEPASKGRTQNDSNKVLNALLKNADKMRLTTTFILAGYKDEMQTLFGYNPGFPSRFPKTFTFDFTDYNEAELTMILSEMTKRRKYRFESQKECGVPIARILAREIHMGAHVKGFGNGRECEKVLDLCIQNQMSRLVLWKENKIPITDNDYRTLTRKDTVGDRPNLEDSSHMAELESMVGLHAVKTKLKNLMTLQLQNYDAKMRGERIQRISLHRVFYGNPGTGKTTVAKLLGKMLKEFRYLTDGDIIICTPADLKGSAVGEGVARTKALLDSAKGKVLFVDEAYNLDPARGSGTFGAEVLDVILEKIEGNAGSDMCVILAGYKTQMEQLFRNVQNPGLKRRFNLGEAFVFEDFSDEDIRLVLKRQVVQAELYATPATLDHAVTLISQKRLEEGFGNAGEAEQMLNRAKLRHSARLSEGNLTTDLKLLIKEDFDGEVTSLEKAREVFADLENIEHVSSVLHSYEAMCSVADDEGNARHELLTDCHMLFLGPPGSGKTTMGKRFARMFKQLNLLPSDRFEYTTAGNLIDRYVGGTGKNTVEAMRRAKGGVLMIDEAYAMLPHKNHFGGDVMQALLDNITTEEYKGKIIVILSGYKNDVEELFGLNPGFQSRFDKKRIEFPEWTGAMASRAVNNMIEREGKLMEVDARDAMTGYFEGLRHLPNWASARDAMEWIKPALDAARAERQFLVNQKNRAIQSAKEENDSVLANKVVSAKSKSARAAIDPPLPYCLDDVRKVFTNAIFSRGGEVDSTGSIVSASDSGQVKSLESVMSFNEIKSTADRLQKLFVVCFTNPISCQPCQQFEPLFDSIAAENSDIMFAKVYASKASGIFRYLEVQSVPHTMLFFNGTKTDDILGCDPSKLQRSVLSHRIRQKKFQENIPAPRPPYDSYSMMSLPPPPVATGGLATPFLPLQTDEKLNLQVKMFKPDGNSSSDNESDDEVLEEDLWAALEDACAALGCTLEQLRDMLSDNTKFPPQELMDLVIAKVKPKKPNNVRKMLQKQRLRVLAKVTTSIEDKIAEKSAEEQLTQKTVQEIGQCPMGFPWYKEESGWRCGGGSHFVPSGEVDNLLYEQEMYF